MTFAQRRFRPRRAVPGAGVGIMSDRVAVPDIDPIDRLPVPFDDDWLAAMGRVAAGAPSTVAAPLAGTPMTSRALAVAADGIAQAMIPVEQTGGPILLMSERTTTRGRARASASSRNAAWASGSSLIRSSTSDTPALDTPPRSRPASRRRETGSRTRSSRSRWQSAARRARRPGHRSMHGSASRRSCTRTWAERWRRHATYRQRLQTGRCPIMTASGNDLP